MICDASHRRYRDPATNRIKCIDCAEFYAQKAEERHRLQSWRGQIRYRERRHLAAREARAGGASMLNVTEIGGG